MRNGPAIEVSEPLITRKKASLVATYGTLQFATRFPLIALRPNEDQVAIESVLYAQLNPVVGPFHRTVVAPGSRAAPACG